MALLILNVGPLEDAYWLDLDGLSTEDIDEMQSILASKATLKHTKWWERCQPLSWPPIDQGYYAAIHIPDTDDGAFQQIADLVWKCQLNRQPVYFVGPVLTTVIHESALPPSEVVPVKRGWWQDDAWSQSDRFELDCIGAISRRGIEHLTNEEMLVLSKHLIDVYDQLLRNLCKDQSLRYRPLRHSYIQRRVAHPRKDLETSLAQGLFRYGDKAEDVRNHLFNGRLRADMARFELERCRIIQQ